MLDIQKIRKSDQKIIVIGSHPSIIQSILDFDFLSKRKKPSIIGIISAGKKYERYFFGKHELLLPVFRDFEHIPPQIRTSITLFLNVSSGRRTFSTSEKALSFFPNLLGGSIFAENTPEQYSLSLYETAKQEHKFIIGPASVGLLLPAHLKLGAIGGTQAKQLAQSQLFQKGTVAAFSASGGMTNEIISLLSHHGKHLSFSLSFGGDRFPICTPQEAFLAAEKDPSTKYIVYYGELGGYDEYQLAELISSQKVTKQVIAYVAGSISEMFENPPQFGHAKAMAQKGPETAQAKRKALQDAGARVATSFKEFVDLIKSIPTPHTKLTDFSVTLDQLAARKKTYFTSTISGERNDEVYILGEDQISFASHHSFAYICASMLLGKKLRSKKFEQFVDIVLRLLVDNGPYQSGAINTMITARAGKDLVSSLVSGLLTIGPRFGGAVNEAAANWFQAVLEQQDPYTFVESFAKERKLILGIGHKKYRIDFPDPRVQEVLGFTNDLKEKKYTTFALAVQAITTAKKGNLILNVDGAMAAVALDLLSEDEGLTDDELQELIHTEFFNALFVLSRSVGLTAQYLDQKRLDEGLFRFTPQEVGTIGKE